MSEQIKHVAAVNYIFGGGILSEKDSCGRGDESGPASGQNRRQRFLKLPEESFAYVHKAIQTGTKRIW